jgi:hypothetical protein
MNDSLVLSLTLEAISGDFDGCINQAEIPMNLMISPVHARQILAMAEALSMTEGMEIQQPAYAGMWPEAELEEATGLSIDSVIFAQSPGTMLVVKRTGFFWRVFTDAFGVLETSFVDIMTLKKPFNLISPLQEEGREVKEDILCWLKDVCTAGTFDLADEADELKAILNELVPLVSMDRLKSCVANLDSQASASPKDDDDHPFPVLHHPDANGEDGIQGGHLLKQGKDLLAKLEGRL